ncbi:hypothetical protein [Paraburkholderia sp. HD33-4]|uniref:hypothetical protein n=1 Tax=Paraburkholderia sp. HD33-4 TaxID=2883242 RepID=UPI001F32816B|nr:hypothetical protein [Paraburkholderia sp. HD33-4]
MNWDDPAERAALAERVGPTEYNRLFSEHLDASIVEWVAGHAIRPVGSRFGRLFTVGNTGYAFRLLTEAQDYARNHPKEEQ